MKKKDKTFRELYFDEKAKPTPSAQFISAVVKATGVSEQAVRQWIAGSACPRDHEIVTQLERHFGADITTLFPNYRKRDL